MANTKLILSSLDLSDSLLACSEDYGTYSICDVLRFQPYFPISCALYDPISSTCHVENTIPRAIGYKGEYQRSLTTKYSL